MVLEKSRNSDGFFLKVCENPLSFCLWHKQNVIDDDMTQWLPFLPQIIPGLPLSPSPSDDPDRDMETKTIKPNILLCFVLKIIYYYVYL